MSSNIRKLVEENDAVKAAMTPTDVEDLIRVSFEGPITRSRAKKIQEGTRALLVRLAAVIHESDKKRWITMVQHQVSLGFHRSSQEGANSRAIT